MLQITGSVDVKLLMLSLFNHANCIDPELFPIYSNLPTLHFFFLMISAIGQHCNQIKSVIQPLNCEYKILVMINSLKEHISKS